MDKNLLSSFVVVLVFFLGGAVELVRGKMIMGIIGIVMGVFFLVMTLIGYMKEKKEK